MMTKTRLEAFSDGVLAIVITIMVLEMKVPHEASLHALAKLWPVFISYVMSFVYIGIYWGNHHHLLYSAHHLNSKILWSNMGLLFFLSLIPFTTAWMGENDFNQIPVAVYGVNLLLCAVAFFVLQKVIMAHATHNNKLMEALKKQERKGNISLLLYVLGIAGAFLHPAVSALMFFIVAIMWVVPDKNIEAALKELKH